MRVLIVHAVGAEGYPPLIHAARALSAGGAIVDVVGASLPVFATRPWPPVAGVRRHDLGNWQPGSPRAFARLVGQTIGIARRTRPDWIWCSDPSSIPAAWAAGRAAGARMVYQEHDAPPTSIHGERWKRRALRPLRRHVLRSADLVLMPNAARLALARHDAGPGRGLDGVVWNVPMRCEIGDARAPRACAQTLRLHFHGTTSALVLPLALAEAVAMTAECELTIAGSDIDGGAHVARFVAHARAHGAEDRVRALGPLSRADALAAAREADVGVAWFEPHPNNINHSHALGASNKVFDYLSQGLALLIHGSEEWSPAFLPRFGRAIVGADAASIASTIRQFIDGVADPRALGELGRRQIDSDWHFERAFEPALAALGLDRGDARAAWRSSR